VYIAFYGKPTAEHCNATEHHLPYEITVLPATRHSALP